MVVNNLILDKNLNLTDLISYDLSYYQLYYWNNVLWKSTYIRTGWNISKLNC